MATTIRDFNQLLYPQTEGEMLTCQIKRREEGSEHHSDDKKAFLSWRKTVRVEHGGRRIILLLDQGRGYRILRKSGRRFIPYRQKGIVDEWPGLGG